ncbi:heme exporter protein CcmB [Aquabacterium sp. J223]|uniref:heme exporter protein CcmB n=1 Tax=Aquabacterium sp. J223 TaxID=2898431 RepID=UPI003916CE3E
MNAETGVAGATLARAGTLAALIALFTRDVRLALRRKADTLGAAIFFVIVTSLFPLGVGPDSQLLARMGPGIVWVAALLASMLAMPRLFAEDAADGTLEQLLLSATPFPLLVLAKVAAHWLVSGLLLAVVAPLIALQYGLPSSQVGVLVLSLLLGTPVLSLVGSIGAALTVGVRGAAVLLALLVLPLITPVLIFGAGAVEAVGAGLSPKPHLSLLGALLALALFGAPWAASTALRISAD